jgi:enoyl-CoA hydratase
MVADLGTLQRLPKLIPEAVVRELAYTGRRLNAQRSVALGLVNEVHANAEASLQAAMNMAREIAVKPPVAVAGSKQAIQYARDHSTADALQQMGWLQAGIWDTNAVSEAVQAMKEKRIADFADLRSITRFAEG